MPGAAPTLPPSGLPRPSDLDPSDPLSRGVVPSGRAPVASVAAPAASTPPQRPEGSYELSTQQRNQAQALQQEIQRLSVPQAALFPEIQKRLHDLRTELKDMAPGFSISADGFAHPVGDKSIAYQRALKANDDPPPALQKEILDNAGAIRDAMSSVKMLESVLKPLPQYGNKSLNDVAYEGATADAATWGARNIPLGGMLFDPKRGEATTSLKNRVMTQSLPQLKGLLGVNPTDRDLKVMESLQALPDKSVKEREIIIRDAIERANEKAAELREANKAMGKGKEFFRSSGDPAAGNGAPAATKPLDAARAAINNGAPREAVIQRLRENGIDPAGL